MMADDARTNKHKDVEYEHFYICYEDHNTKEHSFRSKDMIQIRVGNKDDATLFNIERALWNPSSPVLAAASDQDLRDGNIEVLTTMNPRIFNKYLNFVAYGKVRLTTKFAECYAAGGALSDVIFQNLIIDYITNDFNKTNKIPKSRKASIALSIASYIDDSPLKNLLIDFWAKAGADEGKTEALLDPMDILKRIDLEKDMRSALLRNRKRKIEQYDEEEAAVFKIAAKVEGKGKIVKKVKK